MATRVKRKSWKAMMDSGRDPREGIFSIFRVDCSLVAGLCFYNRYIYIYIYIINIYVKPNVSTYTQLRLVKIIINKSKM